MIHRKAWIVVFALCLCFYLMPYQAMAASTSDAVEPITPEKECSLSVSYCCGEIAFPNVEVKLYRIAEVSADFQYTLTQAFEASGLVLDGIRTAGEWNVVRSTLEAHILAYATEPDAVSATSQSGQVCFDSLETGMYMIVAGQTTQGDVHCLFDTALVSLPGLGQDGRWQYEVSVNAKGEILPPIDSDEEVEFKVLKLWKGDEGRKDRPQNVEVEIFCDGISYQTVILTEENHWAYSWSAVNDGSSWTVVERNVPKGYTMTVEARGSTFVLTNTWNPTNPDAPVKPPQTGDTSNMLVYVLLMIGSGVVLIVLGITGKKMRL